MGFVIEGLFVGYESRQFKNVDGSIDNRHYVNVAIGSLAYRVYISDEEDPMDYAFLEVGSMIRLSCRIYVGKNGKLSVVDGKLVA